MYAKINNGVVEKYPYTIGDLRKDNPNVSFPRQVEMSTLTDYGVVVVEPTPMPTVDYQYDVIEENPKQISGIWKQVWKTVPVTSEELINRIDAIRQAKIVSVDALRDEKLFGDIPYMFPGDVTIDAIQFRDARDRANVQDNVADAMYKLFNEDDSLCYFIAKSNQVKALTPRQMIEMGRSLKQRGELLHIRANAHKEAIRQLTIAQVEAYDITTGWE